MDVRATVGGLGRAGFLDPSYASALATSVLWWRRTPAALFGANALRHPTRLALIDLDSDVRLRYGEIDARTSAIARGMRAGGTSSQSRVGLLAANSAVFVEGLLAASKLGADLVLLNTALAGEQLAAVVERERVDTIIHDVALPPAVAVRHHLDGDALRALRRAHRHGVPPRPSREPKTVLLTSGTTGAPKGARRGAASAGLGSLEMLARVPLRGGERWLVSAPLFHAWGYGAIALAAATSSTLVLRHRFRADDVLTDLDRERIAVLIAVPVMLRRILDADRDTSSTTKQVFGTLRMVLSSGSALPGALVTEWMDRFGDNLYNLYGSTEAGPATVADPADLREAPSTAGRPVGGIAVTIIDEAGRSAPPGTVGRIRIGTPMPFEGYTAEDGSVSAAGKVVGREVHIGDVGYLDDAGRLFVTGRDDDMVISGGENVYPSVTEEALAAHPDVVEVAVIGVPDDEFGQRLAAFVVRRDASALSADAVRAHVGQHASRFAVPRDVTFLDALPRNAAGKVLKAELAAYPAG